MRDLSGKTFFASPSCRSAIFKDGDYANFDKGGDKGPENIVFRLYVGPTASKEDFKKTVQSLLTPELQAEIKAL